jgi:hypothetical protein
MLLPRGPAVVLLSLSSESCEPQADRRPRDGEAVEAILPLLVEQRLAATWASRAAIDWDCAQAIAAQPRQELALSIGRGDYSDLGRQFDGEQVRRQVLRASAGGLSIATLFVVDPALTPDDALLSKCGMAAVCPIGAQGRASRAGGLSRAGRWMLPRISHSFDSPQQLRWGLWRMPTPVRLVQEGARQIRRAIDHVAATAGILHIHVDLPALASAGRRPAGQVDAVLRQLADLQDRGQLRTQTMAQTALSLSRPRRIAPACSILRKKAA